MHSTRRRLRSIASISIPRRCRRPSGGPTGRPSDGWATTPVISAPTSPPIRADASHVVTGVDIDPYLQALRTELAVPGDFSAEVQAEATRVATGWGPGGRGDATDLDLVTVDPSGSRDLDQAFLLERGTSGLLLHYAIADVGA